MLVKVVSWSLARSNFSLSEERATCSSRSKGLMPSRSFSAASNVGMSFPFNLNTACAVASATSGLDPLLVKDSTRAFHSGELVLGQALIG